MSRTCHTLRLGEEQFRLRLTVRGQKNLARRFEENTLQTVFAAPVDSERMSALLEEALNWEGSGNSVTDGEVFYDLLVDRGYQGWARFSALAFDIAAASGLVTGEQARRLKCAMEQAMGEAFDCLDRPQKPADRPQEPESAAPFAGRTN